MQKQDACEESIHDTKHHKAHLQHPKTGGNEHVRHIQFGCLHDTLFANTFL